MKMDLENISKTVLNSNHGHYEYLAMPFGFNEATVNFQHVMNNVIRGPYNILVYLDDIISLIQLVFKITLYIWKQFLNDFPELTWKFH